MSISGCVWESPVARSTATLVPNVGLYTTRDADRQVERELMGMMEDLVAAYQEDGAAIRRELEPVPAPRLAVKPAAPVPAPRLVVKPVSPVPAPRLAVKPASSAPAPRRMVQPHQRINQRRWEPLADWSSCLKGSEAEPQADSETRGDWVTRREPGLSWKASLLYRWFKFTCVDE